MNIFTLLLGFLSGGTGRALQNLLSNYLSGKDSENKVGHLAVGATSNMEIPDNLAPHFYIGKGSTKKTFEIVGFSVKRIK